MNCFELIAIFCTPIFGVSLLIKKEKSKKEKLIIYLRYLALANLVTNILIFMIEKSNELNFTSSFFIKYSFMNIVISIVIALIEIASKKNIKMELEVKNEKN